MNKGLVESTEIVLRRNTNSLPLQMKNWPLFTDSPRLILQLLKKKYAKKQMGHYIVICQRKESTILEGELLLGLPETRTLETGEGGKTGNGKTATC